MKKFIIAMLIVLSSMVVMARPHGGPGPGFHHGGFRPAPVHHGGWHGAVRTHHGWVGAPARGNLYHHRGYYGGYRSYGDYYGGYCAPIVPAVPVVVPAPVVSAPVYTTPVVTAPVVTPAPTVVYPSTTTVIGGPAAGVGVQVGPVSVGAGVRLW